MKDKQFRHAKHPPKEEWHPEHKSSPYLKQLVWVPFIFAFILYGNSISNQFALDDIPQIVENRFVQKGFDGIGELMTTNYWAGSGQNLGYYRPLSMISFAVEKAIHNNNPQIMHFVNVLLYAISGMVVFWFLSSIFRGNPFFVLITTLLFMAHPVHTEVVANVKSRDEMMSFLFSTLALWLVFNHSKNRHLLSLIVAWIMYFLALMSKETAMTTLALVPVLLFFFTPKKGGFIGGVTLSFFIVSVLFLILKYALIGTISGYPPNEMNVYPYKELSVRIPTMFYIFGMYLYRMVLPWRLLYDYSYNQIPAAGWGNPVVLISFLIAAGLVYLAIKNLKRKNILSFSILFFGITLSVGLAFIITRGGIMAERFLYAPILGFSIVVTYYLFKLLPRDIKTKRVAYDFRMPKTQLFLGIILVVLSFYSVRTISRNPVWKDNFTLFSHDVKYGDKSALLLKHYGSEIINQSVAAEDPAVKDSLMKQGMAEVQKAIDINPRFSEAFFKMGYAYYQLRDFKTSIEYYKKANQNNSMTLSNMALSYYMTGEHGEALRLLKKSLQIDPNNNTARQNMPLVQSAFDRKMQSLKTQPSNDPEHYFDLGNLFVEQQKYAEALESFDNALRINPKYLGALLNKGNCQYMLKDYEAAIISFKEVLNQSPDHPMAVKNLSHLYGLMGNSEMQEFYDKKIQGNK